MKTLVTDFDFIRGTFPLLPKEKQDELAAHALVLAAEAEISQEARVQACRLAADEWMISVFNSMDTAAWDDIRGNGYDDMFLQALKENVGHDDPRAFTPHPNGLSLWEDVLFIYAFRMGQEAAK